MTLQENISAMTEIANLADIDFDKAKTKFRSIIASNRETLLIISEILSQPRLSMKWKRASFNEDYIRLFMRSYDAADKLLDRVIAEHGIPEIDFANTELEKIGIVYFSQGRVEVPVWDTTGSQLTKPVVVRSIGPVLTSSSEADTLAVDGYGVLTGTLDGVDTIHVDEENSLLFGDVLEVSSFGVLQETGTAFPRFVVWQFPDKFYYKYSNSHPSGGHEYGDLYIIDSKQAITSEESGLWHEDLKCWGPYRNIPDYIGSGASCTAGPYSRFVELASEICKNVVLHTDDPDSFNHYATFRGDPALAAAKLRTMLYWKYIHPDNWRISFKADLDVSALKAKDVNGNVYYVGTEKDLSNTVHLFVYPLADTDSLFGFQIGKATGGLNPELRTVYDRDTTSPSYKCHWKEMNLQATTFNMTWSGSKPTYVGGDANWQPAPIEKLYVDKSNAGQMLLNFDNFLLGNFGPLATIYGLDGLIYKFGREPEDNHRADIFAGWFAKEARELADAESIINQLTTARSLEQAASLYAVKYALLRVMGGNTRRMQNNYP